MDHIAEYLDLLKTYSLYKHDIQGQFICFNKVLKGQTDIANLSKEKIESLDKCMNSFGILRQKYLESIKLHLD